MILVGCRKPHANLEGVVSHARAGSIPAFGTIRQKGLNPKFRVQPLFLLLNAPEIY